MPVEIVRLVSGRTEFVVLLHVQSFRSAMLILKLPRACKEYVMVVKVVSAMVVTEVDVMVVIVIVCAVRRSVDQLILLPVVWSVMVVMMRRLVVMWL